MKSYMKYMNEELNGESISAYWPNFKMIPYALYDKNQVYIFNHPSLKTEGYHVLPWSDCFIGDTLILFEDHPTAIVNVELHDGYERLYSMLAHELFHGLQYLENEKRFPNEMLVISYPLWLENVELRNKERSCLYNAVMSVEQEDRVQNLQNFLQLRETRAELIGEHISYETAIETIEGPAWYIEMKAYIHKSNQPYHDVLKDYSNPLLDKWDSTCNIRKSCYSSGLLICILLDEFSPNWKEIYFHSEKTLYDRLKQCIGMEIVKPVVIETSKETGEMLQKIEQAREEVFINFQKQAGYHIYLEGEIKVKGFDPMNITRSPNENKLLHRTMLSVEINKETIVIQQPVIAFYKEKYGDVYKLHVVSKERPLQEKDAITIQEVGKLEGIEWKVLGH